MTRLMRMAAALVAMTLAMPAMAQVNWTSIGGEVSGLVCPQGTSQLRASQITISVPQPGETMVNVGTGNLLHALLSLQVGGAATVTAGLAVFEDGKPSAAVFNTTIGTTSLTNPSISLSATQIPNLKIGKRYAANIRLLGGGNSATYATRCFQMAPDLNYVENIGTGSLGATGCFAIGGERLGGGDAAIQACFCGARNRLGQWARTGTVEPGTNLTDDNTYKWMLTSTERVRRGCTSN